MGHAGESGALVARADAEKRVIGDVGDVVVLEQDDLQAVVQLVDADVLGAQPGGERQRQAQQQDQDQGVMDAFHETSLRAEK